MQPTNTTNANPKPNPLTHVGPLWFFIWVIWLTLISALPQATPTVLFVTGLTGAIGLVSIVVSLFVVALGALVLPQPVRQDWLLWIVAGMAGTTASAVLYSLTVQPWVVAAIQTPRIERIEMVLFAASIVGALLYAVTLGVAQMLVLRRRVRNAFWWIVALMIGSLTGSLLTGLTSFVLAAAGVNVGPITSTAVNISPLFNGLATGVALWLLIANTPQDATATPTD